MSLLALWVIKSGSLLVIWACHFVPHHLLPLHVSSPPPSSIDPNFGYHYIFQIFEEELLGWEAENRETNLFFNMLFSLNVHSADWNLFLLVFLAFILYCLLSFYCFPFSSLTLLFTFVLTSLSFTPLFFQVLRWLKYIVQSPNLQTYFSQHNLPLLYLKNMFMWLFCFNYMSLFKNVIDVYRFMLKFYLRCYWNNL